VCAMCEAYAAYSAHSFCDDSATAHSLPDDDERIARSGPMPQPLGSISNGISGIILGPKAQAGISSVHCAACTDSLSLQRQ